MGIWIKLKDLDRKIINAKNKKRQLKNLIDPNIKSEEDYYHMKKAKTWTCLNIVALIPFGLLLYFSIGLILSLSVLSIAGVGLVISICWGYGFSLLKAKKYIDEYALSLWAVIMSKIAIGGLIVVILIVALLTFLFPPVFIK